MRDALPVVEQPVPLVLRLILIAIGIAAIALPASELWRAVWPFNVMSLIVGAIILGAAFVGTLFIAAGVSTGGQRWRYVPRTVLIERRLWRKVWEVRLTTREVAAVEVFQDPPGDPDRWRVRLVPAGTAPVAVRNVREASTCETALFDTREAAEGARRALLAHLGMDDAAR